MPALLFFKEIHRVVIIRNRTFETVLQNKHNSFYALLMPNLRDQRQRKQQRNNKTDTTTVMYQP